MNDIILYKKDSVITNTKAVDLFFDSLNDGKYLLTAKNIRKRSLAQNKYLHGVIIPLVFEGLRNVGYNDVRDNEDAKTVIKTLFLKRKIVNEKTGEVIEIIGKTSDLTAGEMIAFIDEVVRWAAEYLSVVIPAPGEQMPMFSEPMIAHYETELNATIIE